MSSFICEKCGKEIIDTPAGYVTGCEHYPAGDIKAVCRICEYYWDGRCVKGHDKARDTKAFRIFGCKDFKQRGV